MARSFDKTDGVTIETALTITNERITLTADTDAGAAPTNILDNITGATAATANDLNYITGNDAGMMQLELAAADTNRVGRMLLSVTDAANHVPVFHEFFVLPQAIYDWFTGVIVPLPANITQWLGTAAATPTVAGVPEVDLTHVAGATTNVAALATNVDAILTDTGTTLQAELDGIQADTEDIQARLPAALSAGGNIKADVLSLNDDTQSLTDLKDFADAGYDPVTNKVQGVVLADTVTTYTGNTLQTGDNFARIGALGAGLTAVPWNAAWDTEVQSEVDDALVVRSLDKLVTVSGTADSGSASTMVDAARTEGDADYWKGQSLVFTSGTLAGQCAMIIDFNAATDTFTFAPPLTQAVSTHTYIILPGVSVWDDVLDDHLIAGSTGAALNAAGGAGDPWSTALPGAYGAGTAGKIVGDNIDATISSRTKPADTQARVTLVDTLTTYTGNTVQTGDSFARIGAAGVGLTAIDLPNQTMDIIGTLSGSVGSVSGAVGSVTAGVTVTTNNDKTGYGLSATAVQAVWDALTSALTTVGSVGKLLVDNINATIGSRLASASYTAPLDAGGTRSALGLASADVDTQLAALQVSLDTVDDLLDTEVGAIKAKTDQFIFTVANRVDATTQAGLSTLDAAGVRTAVGLASANLDTQLDALPTNAELATSQAAADDATLAAIAALNNLSASQVNAEIVDALAVDTYTEPVQGTPPATTTLAIKISYVYKALRNRFTQSASEYNLYGDDSVTVDQKATFQDDGTTADRGKVISGP